MKASKARWNSQTLALTSWSSSTAARTFFFFFFLKADSDISKGCAWETETEIGSKNGRLLTSIPTPSNTPPFPVRLQSWCSTKNKHTVQFLFDRSSHACLRKRVLRGTFDTLRRLWVVREGLIRRMSRRIITFPPYAQHEESPHHR